MPRFAGPLDISLLADSMKEKIGWAMGWVNSAMTAGFLLSPIVGGIAYAKAGYYAVYYMAFGLIACDIFLRLVLIEKKVARNWIVEDESCTTGSADTTPHESQALNPRGRIDESNEAGTYRASYQDGARRSGRVLLDPDQIASSACLSFGLYYAVSLEVSITLLPNLGQPRSHDTYSPFTLSSHHLLPKRFTGTHSRLASSSSAFSSQASCRPLSAP